MSRLLLLATLLVVSACSLAPDPAPPAPVAELPERFEADSAATDSLRNLRWWRAFQEPSLNRYLEAVLAANLDLTEAVTRVEEARALAGVATADLLPSLTADGEVNRNDSPNNAGFGAQIGELLRRLAGDTTSTGGDGEDGGGDGDDSGEGDGEGEDGPADRFAVTNYTASLTMAYEVDLWGRARNDRRAALADLLASEADLHAVRLGVLAEAVTAWFEWVELDRRVALTAEIVDVLQERVVLTETRYDRGLVGSFELYQIRQDLQNTQAGLPVLRTQLADVRRRLALLAGRFPAELPPLLESAPGPVDPAEPVPAGIPADLLIQRPDVRAEGRRMEAARYRVGARKAELFPSLNLTGTLGLQAVEPEGLVDLSQWFSNLVAGVTAPLFQGGRLRANVDAAEARYARQVAVYGRAVLTAVGEVEVALVRHRQERERYDFLRSQLEEAAASVELQADRYAAGVGEYPDYLDALRNRLTVESTLIQARRDLALARLQLHRALGGSWSVDEPVRPTWADPPTRADERPTS